MVFRLIDCRFLTALATVGFMLAVTGCQSGGNSSFLSPTPKDPKQIARDEGKILASELFAYCPNVTLREGTALFNSYAKGGQDGPDKLVYQTAITDVTRSCKYVDGQMTIKVGVAGKVVVGPAGGAGAIIMPIRVAVTRGEEVLYSELHKHAVQVTDLAQATQWLFIVSNITIPNPKAPDIVIYVGYDEGPAKQAAKK